MKKLLSACAIAVLALAGCASQSGPAPQESVAPPTAAGNANQDACDQIADLTAEVAKMLVSEPDGTILESFRGEVDSVGLDAEGEVQTRIFALRDTIPDHPIVWMVEPANDYFTALEDVGRACAADIPGYEFALSTWS